VEAWNPGEKGGEAVADVLFGDFNPSGRLAITIPRSVGQLPVYYDI
jgi:beta-glucosidase